MKELPFFSDLYKAHEGDIAMLALHSDVVDDDPKEYLNEHGKDWVMPFAVENEDEKIWDGVGGTTAMPQTIVLNRHGEVIYNQRGSVTAEILETLYQQAAEPRSCSKRPPGVTARWPFAAMCLPPLSVLRVSD